MRELHNFNIYIYKQIHQNICDGLENKTKNINFGYKLFILDARQWKFRFRSYQKNNPHLYIQQCSHDENTFVKQSERAGNPTCFIGGSGYKSLLWGASWHWNDRPLGSNMNRRIMKVDANRDMVGYMYDLFDTWWCVSWSGDLGPELPASRWLRGPRHGWEGWSTPNSYRCHWSCLKLVVGGTKHSKRGGGEWNVVCSRKLVECGVLGKVVHK